MKADVPMSKLMIWAIAGAICPEPFVDLNLKPGETKSWTLTYTFTTGIRKLK
jgi:hypothetical protein